MVANTVIIPKPNNISVSVSGCNTKTTKYFGFQSPRHQKDQTSVATLGREDTSRWNAKPGLRHIFVLHPVRRRGPSTAVQANEKGGGWSRQLTGAQVRWFCTCKCVRGGT